MFFKKPQPITDELIGEDAPVCICSSRIAGLLLSPEGGAEEQALRNALRDLATLRNQEDGEGGGDGY